jgi:hypothetical protein
MPEISAESQSVLRDAGWEPGRRVDISDWVRPFERAGIEAHEAARMFLSEFGGIAVSISGPGVNKAREPFELDPLLCYGEDDRFIDWSRQIERALFPIGVLDSGRFFLGIDEYSEIYLVETWIASFGRMPDALDNLIRGVRPAVVREGLCRR